MNLSTQTSDEPLEISAGLFADRPGNNSRLSAAESRRATRRPSPTPGYSDYPWRRCWQPAWFSTRRLRRPASVSGLTATLAPPARTQYLPQVASFLRREAVRARSHPERSVPRSAQRTRAARSPATDESRCREPAVARLAPQKAGLARPSDSSRTDFRGQDVCRIVARALHRILGWPRRSTLVVSDRLRGIAAGQRPRSRQELLSHPWHHRRGACYDRAGIWAGPIRRTVRGRGRRVDVFV